MFIHSFLIPSFISNFIEKLTKVHEKQILYFIGENDLRDFYKIGFLIVLLYMWTYQIFYCYGQGLLIASLISLISVSTQYIILFLYKKQYLTKYSMFHFISITNTIFVNLEYINSGAGVSPASIWLTLPPMLYLILFNTQISVFYTALCIGIAVLSNWSFDFFGVTYNEWTPEIAKNIMRDNILTAPILVFFAFRFYSRTRTQLIEERTKLADHNKKLFQILMHDLRNPTFSIEGMIERNAHINELKPHIQHMKVILEGAKEYSLSQELLLNHEEIPFTLHEVKQRIKHLFKDDLQKKGIYIKFKDSEKVHFKTYYNPFMNHVVTNLVSNAIKFSPENSLITLSTNEINGAKFLIIKDQGKGLDTFQMEQLSRGQKLPSTTGTNNEKGAGFGLKIAMDTLKQMNCKIYFYNKKGLEIKIEIPSRV